MTFEEIIWGIIIGLATGGISGFIVSRFFERRAATKEVQQRFEFEKQELSQFLHHVFDELAIIEQKRDVSRLIWILGTKPFCNCLYQSTKEDNKKILASIDDQIEEICTFCFCRLDSEPFDPYEEKTIVEWSNKVIQIAGRVKNMSQ